MCIYMLIFMHKQKYERINVNFLLDNHEQIFLRMGITFPCLFTVKFQMARI